ncbi:RusA family crossover junction endodeoxyribonuclease [Enterobacter sp.]|uniref:RusA family crossover junction endodeoxyribonuclease n=1 Tax=Enterobacter sp. TaxID=42895 RepID=UPI00296E771D|nr:RusA family crossover junction endodeoxyribonuclease [Enterobacter sp.]
MATTIVEFAIIGRPASVNSGKGSATRKKLWKALVHKEASSHYSGSPVCYETTIKVFYFPHNGQYTDVDNGLKYTLDGIKNLVINDDKQVTRIIAERFLRAPGASLVVPLSAAAPVAGVLHAMELRPKKDYVTLIKLEKYECNGGLLW